MQACFEHVAIQLHPDDPVAIARQDLAQGDSLVMPSGDILILFDSIPTGHKLALRELKTGEPVLRYGNRIGMATADISPGQWVHSHNCTVGDIQKSDQYHLVPPLERKAPTHTFQGYARPDGRAGTRNYIAVISSVSCASHVTTEIARAFTPEKLAGFPNVGAVIPIIHHSGCSMPAGGLAHRYLQRTLANVARNPNIGGVVFVGLGCEINQMDEFCNCEMSQPGKTAEIQLTNAPGLMIQDQGGFRKTVDAGIKAVEALLPKVNAVERTPQPISVLTAALQCGGSDGWSGVTANPLVGLVADEIIRQGGTAVLAETPEIFGAEHLLAQRVTSQEAGQKLMERLSWWAEQSALLGFSVDNNPTPGNKRGGLTTIYEKSLGAVAKGGSTPVTAVYEYAQPVTRKGLVFMDTPGNDPVSVTGQLAGGCNLILFTTGRGSVYGSNIAPCVKIATNSALFDRMSDDMDFNAGRILEGTPLPAAAEELLELVLAVASGDLTRSEEKGLSENEFIPWQPGPVV
ncbi:MAG: UxaA family hydrolase [Omnitrophica WOR_2 bacterium]